MNLQVHIPTLGQYLDFSVPKSMTVKNMKSLMLELIEEEYKLVQQNSNQLALIHVDKKAELPLTATLHELAIVNGTQLLLL